MLQQSNQHPVTLVSIGLVVAVIFWGLHAVSRADGNQWAQTVNGVGIGMSRDQVVAALGKPDLEGPVDSQKNPGYEEGSSFASYGTASLDPNGHPTAFIYLLHGHPTIIYLNDQVRTVSGTQLEQDGRPALAAGAEESLVRSVLGPPTDEEPKAVPSGTFGKLPVPPHTSYDLIWDLGKLSNRLVVFIDHGRVKWISLSHPHEP
jgi:hypothetical protein